VMVAWMLLHAGTMWLNAALDRDRGEVLFGESLPIPRATVPAALLALAAAVVLAALVDPFAGLCALGCAALAFAYSHPALAWKAHPLGGPAVNAIGYGVLSPLAGWSLVGVTGNPRTWVSLGLMVAWILGCYFAAQVFQEEEDRARGYRTLVATHGPAVTLRVARTLLGATAVVFFALTLVGWYPRAGLLAIPMYVWADRALRPRVVWDGEWGAILFRRLLLFGWVLLACIFAEYVQESLANQPVAGLGTASGRPADRPLLPPAQMRRWERQQALDREGQ